MFLFSYNICQFLFKISENFHSIFDLHSFGQALKSFSQVVFIISVSQPVLTVGSSHSRFANILLGTVLHVSIFWVNHSSEYRHLNSFPSSLIGSVSVVILSPSIAIIAFFHQFWLIVISGERESLKQRTEAPLARALSSKLKFEFIEPNKRESPLYAESVTLLFASERYLLVDARYVAQFHWCFRTGGSSHVLLSNAMYPAIGKRKTDAKIFPPPSTL